MCDGYCLIRHSVRDKKGRNHSLYALGKIGGGHDVVTELQKRGDPNDLLGMSVRSVMAIQQRGLGYAVSRKLARKISDNVFLVEFKSRATAWRMAAYIRERQANRTVSVLIDIFKGHSGKSGKYRKIQ